MRTKLLSQPLLTFFLLSTILRSSKSSNGECPTECFCPEATPTITCIGDRHLSLLPILNISAGGQGQTKPIRLEIRDYVLPDLVLGPIERNLFFRGGVSELILAHNQIQGIRMEEEDDGISNPEQEPQHPFTLTLLDLSNNNLTSFSYWPAIINCKILDLSSNFLVKVNLTEMRKLESLNLRGNGIQNLPENTFETLESLHYINLDNNRLRTLSPHLFSPLPALAHLILSSNPLQLSPGFIFNSRSQFIDLSHTGLTLVPPSLTTTVRDFRLNNNNLSSIGETDFESYPNLGLLVLDENQIYIIEDDAFGRMEFLTGLWINGNRLSRIPQNLPSSLRSLQLEDNHISILNQSDFLSLRNLETLNLHGNQLTSLDPDIFAPLTRLRTLMLRSNSLDSLLPSTFSNLSSLQILDISQNPLKVIVNGAFSPLPHLSVLHLSRFGEVEVEFDPSQIFSPLISLQILDLSYSSNFCKKAITGLSWFKSLRELNVDSCDLNSGHLKVICEQVADLESLRIVKGAGNPFGSGGLKGLSVYVPNKICPTPTSLPVTTTSPQVTPIVSLTTSVPSPSVATPKSVVTTSRSPSFKTVPPVLQNSPPSESPVATSSYFESPFPSARKETNEDIGREEAKVNEDRDEGGSIDGFPALTTGTEEDHPSPNTHHLPEKMLLQSPSIQERISDSYRNSNKNGHQGTSTNGNLILRTILISTGTSILSLFLLLGLALLLFRFNRGRISNSGSRRETPHSSYARLEDKQEVELGISNRIYFTNNTAAEDGQVFTIS